jgi:hypothetical protein
LRATKTQATAQALPRCSMNRGRRPDLVWVRTIVAKVHAIRARNLFRFDVGHDACLQATLNGVTG